MLKKHIKIAAVAVGIAAVAFALSAVPHTYKTSVFLAQSTPSMGPWGPGGPGGPGGAIPAGLPASMLSPILKSLESGIIGSLGNGVEILRKLEYIPSKNSILEKDVNTLSALFAETDALLKDNEATLATNQMNYLQQLAPGLVASFAKSSEAKELKEKMQADIDVVQDIVTSAEEWVGSYAGNKSTVQTDLATVKTGLEAVNTNFSANKYPEAAVHFANTIAGLVDLLPVVAPSTASDELNFVYQKASILGVESSELKAKAGSSSKAKKASSVKEAVETAVKKGGASASNNASIGGGKGKEKVSEAVSAGG